MALDDIFYVWQAGVAEFYGIFVYNFVIDVIFREMLIYEAEEFFPICVLTFNEKGGLNHVIFLFFLFLCLFDGEGFVSW